MEWALAVFLRPLLLLILFGLIVRPLAKLVMRFVKNEKLRALLLRRTN
jgi:hypothetical protein